jgi:hypothetical protein
MAISGSGMQHDVSTGQSRFPEHNGFPRRGLPRGTSGWGPSTGELGRSGEPMVGSPIHPVMVMPDLIVLWEISLWGGGRAGGGHRPSWAEFARAT